MTGDEYKQEWDAIQEWLKSPAHYRQMQAETARHLAWMNLTFGMALTPEMNPDEMAAYFETWDKEHGYPPISYR